MHAALVVWMLVMLTGCASLNREQCQRGDWYGIGMADGQVGELAQRMDRHVRACAEYGIRVDDQQYRTGYERGLAEYCTIDNAFESGLLGRRYQRVCPPAIDALFERCNEAAYDVYRIKRELDDLENRIDDVELRLYSRDLSDSYRHQLRRNLRDLEWRHDRLRTELYYSEQSLNDLRNDVKSHPLP
jgi:hypothetical protein